MKRSCTGDNSPIIKKKVRDSNKGTPSTPTPVETIESTPSDMSLLRYVHDLVQNLEQGNIDHCLSNNKTDHFVQDLSEQDAELFKALDLNLKKIAQRQLQLETENLRCRIMIQQQHQLLTATPIHQEETAKKDEKNNNDATSEDNLTSVHDTSLLEKLETSYRQMPHTIPELPQGGYFGKKK